jgi:tetratricopeptide (TPR) repeat protein
LGLNNAVIVTALQSGYPILNKLNREAAMDISIEEYREKSDILQRNANFDQNLALWQEATRKYPDDYSVLSGYMAALSLINQACGNPQTYADEIIRAGERLFTESTEVRHKYDAIWVLARLYDALGNEEKALEYAFAAPGADITHDNLLSVILKGEKAVAHIQGSLFSMVYLAYNQLAAMAEQGDFTVGEREKIYRAALKLIDWLYEDGDYGFFATRVSDIYYALARCAAEVQDAGACIANLESSARYAILFQTQKGFAHTSFLANRIAFDGGQGYPNSAENGCRMLLHNLENGLFDFCRGDERFNAVIGKLEKHEN